MTAPVDRYPLSPMQAGMLYHHLSSGGDTAGVDIEQIVCTLPELVDADAMRRAWESVARRHTAFRTSLRWEGEDEPVQEVWNELPLAWREERWNSDPEPDARLDAWLEADRAAGFRLDSPPLWRLALLRQPGESSTLVWTFHHVLLDGRSFPVVLREALGAYDALRAGQPLPNGPARPYREFVDWLRGQRPENAREFWAPRLAGFRAATPVPGAGTGGVEGPRHANIERRLPGVLTRRLQALAADHAFTLATVVQAAWGVLLSRYSGELDVLFGATRACRRSSIPDADGVVGVFINTLPVRVNVDPAAGLVDWLRSLRAAQQEVFAWEHTPLVLVQSWGEVARGTPLFETNIVFDNFELASLLQSQGGPWSRREFKLHERAPFAMTLYAAVDEGLLLTVAHDGRRVGHEAARRVADHLATILEGIAAGGSRTVGELPMLTAGEERLVVREFNRTEREISTRCAHEEFEAHAAHRPAAPAVACGGEELTYGELNIRANRLAHRLRSMGVGPESRVGIAIERSVEMVVAVLGVLKAGGAYVPLDPSFPADRIRFMIDDAGLAAVLTQEHLADALPGVGAPVLSVDSSGESDSEENPAPLARPDHAAYVIYTSGSTGWPKGVIVEHRNVANFFAGMDERLGAEPAGIWLAVTSLSFDISILELLWTLTRGFKVVVYRDAHKGGASRARRAVPGPSHAMDFSLFYFAADEGGQGNDRYRLLLEGARFADRHGFAAVWTPERHFHAFGGLYPNPSVTGAALAFVTERVQIRAGSVVLPLHHPARVAEEWALVDNLSRGRVGVAFASGWQPVDFVLRPESYPRRQQALYEGIETVRKLWRGEAVEFPGADGKPTAVRTLPRPVQAELPIWVTTAGSVETWLSAARLGANILTHLLGQTVEEIADKVRLYREELARHQPGRRGTVTIMLHTFVGEDDDEVKDVVREPMVSYLGASLSLVKNVASSWAAFKRRADGSTVAADLDLKSLTPGEMRDLLEFSFERYFETSGLFGTPETCLKMVERLAAVGIDEIACLVDFGVPTETALRHLDLLNEVRARAASATRSGTTPASTGNVDESIGALIQRHGVTHLQCTPSMARMILMDEESKAALRGLRVVLIGGEPLPGALAADVSRATGARLLNMYGPTETTIWSSTHAVTSTEGTVPIGTPIANTELYVLDSAGRPAPVGISGELFIGGLGVARGYHNRPDLTAERFVGDPFSPRPGARMYRTGDLARWRPDGTMEFLGRADQQVKIRGHRIELGEIESAIAGLAGVREAAVVLREDTPGDQRLVAYVVIRPDAAATEESVRGALRATLPEYMVPAHVVFLPSLPLTPNKKVDRKALPGPEAASAPRPTGPPASAVEEQILKIWREVLGVSDPGVADNFFDLGGHSLLAVKAHRRLKEVFQRELAITDLFRFPTARALAEYLHTGGTDRATQESRERAGTRREMLQRRRIRTPAGGAEDRP